jgi:hypothetical protein
MPTIWSQLPLVLIVLGLFFGFAVAVRRGVVTGKAIIGVGALVSALAIGAWVVYWLPIVQAGLPIPLLITYIAPMAVASVWAVWTAYRSQLVADVATHTVGDTKIIVRVCGAQKIPDADSLLLPTTTSLRMIDGLPGTVGFVAGAAVQKEAIQQGPVGMGKIVATGPGKLGVGRILHVAVSDPLKPVDENRLRKGMEGAAQQARKLNSESIAVTVGAMRGLTVQEAASAIVGGVLKQRKAFAEIVFLTFTGRDGKDVAAVVAKEIAVVEATSAGK